MKIATMNLNTKISKLFWSLPSGNRSLEIRERLDSFFMSAASRDLLNLSSGGGVEVLTANLTDSQLTILNRLTDEGVFPSRSEAIRFIMYYEILKAMEAEKVRYFPKVLRRLD